MDEEHVDSVLRRPTSWVFYHLKLIRDTVQLEIHKINYLWGIKPEANRDFYPNNGILKELAKFAYRLMRATTNRFLFREKARPPSQPILFYADSVNQFLALRPIKERIGEGAFWVERGLPGELCFPAWFARVVASFFLPVLAFRVLQNAFPRWTLGYGFADYLDSYGYYLTGVLWLGSLRPRALVLSNDHCAQTRALMLAARRLSIPTVYVQHASVTKDFPPLEFDYALLDGRDALEKYSFSNRDCCVYLVGNSRRTVTLPLKRRVSETLRLGLAFSEIDATQVIERLYKEIQRGLPSAMVVTRPHPAERRRYWLKGLSNNYGGQFSDPRVETVRDFLENLDFLIAGTSNILLDAAFLGVIPLQHYSLTQGADYYGFLESGIARVIKTSEEVMNLFRNLPEIKMQIFQCVRKYDATYGTEFDGKASELAAAVLRDRLLGVENEFVKNLRVPITDFTQ